MQAAHHAPAIRRALVDFDEPEPPEEFDDDDPDDDDEDERNVPIDVIGLK